MTWGPWIDHDGKGRPVPVGTWVQVQLCHGGILDDRVRVGSPGRSWDWSHYPEFNRVIRYRVRRPKGMDVIDHILEDVEQGRVREIEPVDHALDSLLDEINEWRDCFYKRGLV